MNISLLKYFWTAWLVQKLIARKYDSDNAVQGHLSKNYLNYHTKYLRFMVLVCGRRVVGGGHGYFALFVEIIVL